MQGRFSRTHTGIFLKYGCSVRKHIEEGVRACCKQGCELCSVIQCSYRTFCLLNRVELRVGWVLSTWLLKCECSSANYWVLPHSKTTKVARTRFCKVSSVVWTWASLQSTLNGHSFSYQMHHWELERLIWCVRPMCYPLLHPKTCYMLFLYNRNFL
jgi:hypothetical protein